MIERADQPPQRALADRILEHDAGGLRLLHEVGEGEDRVARHDALGVVPAQRDLPAGFAPDHAGVGDAARQGLAQEVRHQLAHGRGGVTESARYRVSSGPRCAWVDVTARASSGPWALARSRSAKKSRVAASDES